MPHRSREKVIGQLTQQEYELLRSLTDVGPLDAALLERSVNTAVRDRFALARSLIAAAKLLAGNDDPLIRRSAVSRSYYGAYHAARAAVFAVRRHDEDRHGELAKTVDAASESKVTVGGVLVGVVLKELRLRRDELDYSPYPGPDDEAEYEPTETEDVIRRSLQQAEGIVDALDTYLKERR